MLDRLACETARSIVDLIDAPWVVRLACRAYALAVERRQSHVAGAVTSPERCRLALDIGLAAGRAFVAAVAGGHVDVLQWMDETDVIDWSDPAWPAVDVCLTAARGGHVGALKWARDNSYPWDRTTTCWAAAHGHLEVLQWAHENGCPWGRWTCASAARGGHLRVLQWAREHLCPWDKMTCLSAARAGHLVVLQWARSQGCPWDRDACLREATSAVADWIEAQ
jgi:hypothetical protein